MAFSRFPDIFDTGKEEIHGRKSNKWTCARRSFSFLVFSCVVLASLTSRATTVIKVSEDELISLADAIVVGTVIESSAFLNAHGRIRTRGLLRIDKVIKGASVGEVISIEVPGGILESGISANVHGAPRLKTGETWLGFLYRRSDGVFIPLGLSAGFFPTHLEPDGAIVIERNITDISFQKRDGSPADFWGPTPSARFLDEHSLAWEVEDPSGEDNPLPCHPTDPTYYPRGDHWVGPIDGTPLSYRVQQDGAPGMTLDSSKTAINLAFDAWTERLCGGESLAVDFAIGADYPTKDRGDDLSNEIFENIIYWVTGATDWENIADPLTLALSTNVYFTVGGYTVTSDIEFNAVHFNWRYLDSGCTGGEVGCYDVLTVAMHEIGHWFGFAHVLCTDAVMYPSTTTSDEITALSLHESEGMCAVYNPLPYDTTTSQWGQECATEDDCPGELCFSELLITRWHRFCSSFCVSSLDCPGAWVCSGSAGGGLHFCKPGIRGIIFEDGFENGDTTAWSSAS